MPPLSILLIESSDGTRALSGTREVYGSNRHDALAKLVLAMQGELGIEIKTELAEREITPLDRAHREFMGDTCAACGASKTPQYWFCMTCWRRVEAESKEWREGLWKRKIDPITISKSYWPAKNWLKQTQGEVKGTNG